MHRTDALNNVAGLFSDVFPGTQVDDDWLNAVQEEIVAVILNAGISLVKGTNNQLLAAIQAGLNTRALASRLISTAGLATGGGSLGADRTITVPKASGAEVIAGSDDAKAITPAGLAAFPRSLGSNGFYTFPGGFRLHWTHGTATGNATTSIDWSEPFPTACFAAWCNAGFDDPGAQDNFPYVSSFSIASATVKNAYLSDCAATIFGIGN